MRNIEKNKAHSLICPFMSQAIIDEEGNSKFAAVACRTSECMSWKSDVLDENGKCLLIPNAE